MGRYKNPQIVSASALRAASAALRGVQLVCGSYEQSTDFIDSSTFVYLDPPYRPLSRTSSFTAYTKDAFDDDAQRRLASFFKEMANRGAHVLLSNSDPKNTNSRDDFFDALYRHFRIERISAGRAINAKGESRGQISELLLPPAREMPCIALYTALSLASSSRSLFCSSSNCLCMERTLSGSGIFSTFVPNTKLSI